MPRCSFRLHVNKHRPLTNAVPLLAGAGALRHARAHSEQFNQQTERAKLPAARHELEPARARSYAIFQVALRRVPLVRVG